MVRALLLVLAGVLFFGSIAVVATWAPDQPVDQLKPRWARPPSRFLEVNGLNVHLRDEGPHNDPVPIVLLHGTSASLHTWEGWTQALRDKRRVIRFDLPGFGLTGPNPENDYSTEAYVQFVRAVMDKLGVQRFVLAGNSLGGQIAWSAAAAMPDRVDRLILVDASGYPPESMTTPQSIPLGFRIAATPGLRLLSRYTLPRGVVESTLRSVYGDPSKVTPELVDLYSDMTLRRGNRKALSRRIEQGYTGNVGLLKQIQAPTLVLWGGKDRLMPLEFGQRFVRDIAGARLVVFEDLGHVPHEEDPSRTVDEVRRFLAS
ncbi:alpha/beta hydrolase [Caenimonas sp. S4]|nr:alpha/beta hydrolase [Caenimonas soli]